MKEYKISMGNFFDQVSILEIKIERGGIPQGNESDELINEIKEIIKESDILRREYYYLKHINELIWWCMDRQRIYEPESRDDRREIGMIVVELNNIRDDIKKRINKYFEEETKHEEKFYPD